MTIRTRLMMGLAMASVMATPAAMAEGDSTKKHGMKSHMTTTSSTQPSPTTEIYGKKPTTMEHDGRSRNMEGTNPTMEQRR